MSTILNDEQTLLIEQLRSLLSEHTTSESLRTIADKPGSWSSALWHQLVELGMLGVHIPESFGGAGLGALELGLVVGELGRSLAPVPFFSSICLAAEALMISGTEQQKERWLPRLASGESVGTLAWTEGPTAPSTRFVATRYESGRLTGSKLPVADGSIADLCVVVAVDGSRPCLTLVELDQPGVECTVLPSIDQLSPQCRLDLSGASAELMDAALAESALDQLLDRAVTLRAFEQVGGAEAAMFLARDYTLDRYIFGRQLASFQAVKHKLADILAMVELAQCNALGAAQALDTNRPQFASAAATARIGATRAYEAAAREGLQLHGGIGYTIESDCHHHYRRARLLALSLGSSEYWNDRLIDSVDSLQAATITESKGKQRSKSEPDESLEDRAYRERVREWIREQAAAQSWTEPPRAHSEEETLRARAWAKLKFEAGYASIDTPAELGGAGGTRRQARIFREEEAAAGFSVRLGPGYFQAMTAIQHHASPEQRKKWETLTHSGEATWCQLFSEPAAGSDLAALRTRGTRDGDTWTFHGQKVWTSGGEFADYGILLARTNPSVPKHQGISFFILDMNQPGVTTRPIHQINGESKFSETFLDGATTPDENRIGEEGGGWAVAMTVLGHERNTADNQRGGVSRTSTRSLLELARSCPRENGRTAADSAAVRGRIAQFHVEAQGIKNFTLRLQKQLAATGKLPSAMPVMKLTTTNRLQQIHAFRMDLEEAGGIVQFTEPEQDKFYDYLTAAGNRIAGGADEVLRNQIAERALGMPSEPRADKGVPFDQLPS